MVMRMVVDLSWTGASGSPGVNVWHLRDDDGLGVETLTEAIRQFYDAIDSIFPATTTISFDGQLTNGIEGEAPTYESAPAWSVTGTQPGGYAPPATALVVSWGTQSATRSGRGRTFLGPIAYNVVQADGTPDAPYLAVVRAAAETLVDTSGGFTNGAIGVWSPTNNILRDITTSRVNDRFAVLRSRRD